MKTVEDLLKNSKTRSFESINFSENLAVNFINSLERDLAIRNIELLEKNEIIGKF